MAITVVVKNDRLGTEDTFDFSGSVAYGLGGLGDDLMNADDNHDNGVTEDPLLGFNFMLEIEGSTADYQHDYTFQNNQTDMEFIF